MLKSTVVIALLLLGTRATSSREPFESGDPAQLTLYENLIPSPGDDAGYPEVHECALRATIETTEISLQVYLLASMGGGLLPAPDHEVVASSRKGEQTARTDNRGFVRFRGLSPGEYELHVPAAIMEPYYQNVRVTRSGSGPTRTIAVVANMTCGHACTVDSALLPFVTAPSCLFAR